MNGWTFIRLINALRQVSLSISAKDILDAQTCLARYPEIPPKQILRSLFIHRPQDTGVFEAVWRIVVGCAESLNSQDSKDTSVKKDLEDHNSPGIGGQGTGRGTGGISLTSCRNILDSSKVSRMISLSRIEELVGSEQEFEDIVKKILTDLDYFTWINSSDLAYQRGSLSEDDWILHHNARATIINEIQQQILTVQVKHHNSWEPLVRQHWLYKSLSLLSEEEKELVKSSIRKWTRKLALNQGARWKSSKKGTIDIAQIIRQSVQWDGHFFKLYFRNKIPQVPELVVLCDVSNSMASFVEFLIYVVTCFRERIRKVRILFFIDSIWDVTELVRNEELTEVKQEIKSWGHKVSSGFSNYGAVFRELAEKKLQDISSQAVLVILGDGKNNYHQAQAEYLAQIAEKVRKVFWLNPLERSEWSEPDNTMREYQIYCSKVYRCRTARDLQKIVKDVF
ncbi:von Willebrand factor A [Desulfosporosinus sp. HMP52]|nr:von Willebrand factor A [Desulfosporosinus sp. HMP52]